MASHILKLNNGDSFPALGFGTYSAVKGQAYKATLHALRSGFRHIDTAFGYDNEEEVGQAIKDFLSEKKDVSRSDLFITTKVADHCHSAAFANYSATTSLQKLGLDYVDLLLVHWPIALVPSSSDPSNGEPKKDSSGAPLVDEDLTKNPRPTWEAMEKLNKEGKAKAIGVSNWTIAGIKAMKEYAKILPAVNQVEIHPLLPNQKLLDYCESEGIKLAAYSPLGGQGADNPLFSDEKLGAVARDHGHTIVQVLIAWGLKRGHAVLAKSFTPSRIEENLKVVDLSEEEFKAVESAIGERRKRTCPYYASKAIDKKWLAEYWKRDEEEDA